MLHSCQVPMHPRSDYKPYTKLLLSIIGTANNMCPHKHVQTCLCSPQNTNPLTFFANYKTIEKEDKAQHAKINVQLITIKAINLHSSCTVFTSASEQYIGVSCPKLVTKEI